MGILQSHVGYKSIRSLFIIIIIDHCLFVCVCVASDTQVLSLTLSTTEIPPAASTSIVQAFTLPNDVVNGDFYVVGHDPLIVNDEILHHMIFLGCPDERGRFIVIQCDAHVGHIHPHVRACVNFTQTTP